MKEWLAWGLSLGLLAAGLRADGPETGVLSGRITTEEGAPIPGALVVLEGDRGGREQRTNETGLYRFGLLPPGSYAVRASMEPFTTAEGRVSITAGGTTELDLELTLSTDETVIVIAESPVIDKFNIVAGARIEAETAGQVSAVNRSFLGAIDLLPGVTHDDESLYLGYMRPSVNGALWQEQSVYIDGVDATYSMRGGSTRVFFPTVAVEEINMQAGGSGSEYGRNVGSHTNLIVKSGSNRFHGEVTGVFARDKWNSNYDSQPALAEDERLVESFEQMNEDRPENERTDPEEEASEFLVFDDDERDGGSDNLEAYLGGPIVRDQAWFFVSRADVTTDQLDKILDGTLLDVSTEMKTTLVKVNVQPAARHSLALTWIDSPSDRLLVQTHTFDRYAATFFRFSGDVASLSWNSTLRTNLFVEGKAATQTSNEDRSRPFPPELKAADPAFAPDPALGEFAPVNNDAAYTQRRDSTTHNGWRLGLGYGTNEFPRDQVNFAATQFLARHELRYGLDLQQVDWLQDVQRPNRFFGDEFDATTEFGYEDGCRVRNCQMTDYNPADVVAGGKGSASSQGRNYGAYLRDRFEVGNHWVFNLGLRWEDQRLKNDRGRTVIDSGDLSPRLSAAYDFGGNGRRLMSLSVGRSFTQTPQNLVNTNLQEDWTGASNALDLYLNINSLGFVSHLPDDVACERIASFGFPTNLDNGSYCFLLGSIRPGELWQIHDDPNRNVDIDIDPYHRDEIVLGYEWQLGKSWIFDAKGIWWRLDNLIGSTIQRNEEFGLFQLVENYDDYPSILRELDWVENFVGNGIGTRERAEEILNSFEDDNRSYRALQLQLNKRFSKGWALYNNLTLGRAEGKTSGSSANNLNDDYGRNLEFLLTDDLVDAFDCERLGLDTSCRELLRPHVGEPVSTIHRDGVMPTSRDLIFKSYGYKLVEVGGGHEFSIGGNFFYQTGAPWNHDLTVFRPPTSRSDQVYSVEALRTFLEPRGSLENGDMWSINLSGSWAFPLGRPGLEGWLRIEAYNVVNRQQQISTNSRTGAPRRSRRSFQRPRTMRVLLGVRF